MSVNQGKILRVDLSAKSMHVEPLSEATARAFLGGRGLGAKILFDELKPGLGSKVCGREIGESGCR